MLMAQNFFLTKPKASTGLTFLYLIFKFHSQSLKTTPNRVFYLKSVKSSVQPFDFK